MKILKLLILSTGFLYSFLTYCEDPKSYGYPNGKYDKKPAYIKTKFNEFKHVVKGSFKSKIKLTPIRLSEGKHYNNFTNSKNLTILVMGDTGTGHQEQFVVGNQMKTVCSQMNCNLALHMGDIIYANGLSNTKRDLTAQNPRAIDDNDLNKIFHRFFNPYKNLPLSIWTAPGNHDWRGNIQSFIAFTDNPINLRNKPILLMPYNYFNVEGLPNWISIFGYDSTVIRHPGNYETDTVTNNSVEQTKQDMAMAQSGLSSRDFNQFCNNKTNGWKFLFAHHGIVSSSNHGHKNDGGLAQKIGNAFRGKARLNGVIPGLFENITSLAKRCGIQVYLAGHDHVIEQQLLKLKGQPPFLNITQGAGAKIGKVYNPDYQHPLIESREHTFLKANLGFSILRVTPDQMQIIHYYLENNQWKSAGYLLTKSTMEMKNL